jgi:hypothetical protein
VSRGMYLFAVGEPKMGWRERGEQAATGHWRWRRSYLPVCSPHGVIWAQLIV